MEVDKRSGGGRTFGARWDNTSLIDSFMMVADALQEREKEIMSSSLAYRLDSFRDGIKAIIEQHPDKLPAFVEKQLQRSGTGTQEVPEKLYELARHIAAILSNVKSREKIPTEALVVANFIGHCRQERRDGQA